MTDKLKKITKEKTGISTFNSSEILDVLDEKRIQLFSACVEILESIEKDKEVYQQKDGDKIALVLSDKLVNRFLKLAWQVRFDEADSQKLDHELFV